MEYGRLSKLQKWILEKCYEQGEEKTYFISRRQLIREYCIVKNLRRVIMQKVATRLILVVFKLVLPGA